MKRSELLLIASVLISTRVAAIEAGQLSTISTGDDSFSGLLTEPAEVAKVRLPIKLTNFEQIIIRNPQGVQRIEHKSLAPVNYNLRATINHSNHFYISDWHIETVPMKWDKDKKLWDAQIKFYKRFGQDQELEEFVGTMSIAGKLLDRDQGMVYLLETKGRQQFQNKRGNPLLLAEVGQFAIEQKGKVAKRDKK